MKKIIFSLIFIFYFANLNSENFIIQGKILEHNGNNLKILDNENIYNIQGEFPCCCKKGELIKIFIDKNGQIKKIIRINGNLKSLRERIKKIGKIKNFHRNRGCCRYPHRRKR